jgi:hypothetical protein
LPGRAHGWGSAWGNGRAGMVAGVGVVRIPFAVALVRCEPLAGSGLSGL